MSDTTENTNKTLEAPDLDPIMVFDLPTLVMLGALSLMVTVALGGFLGTLFSIALFFGTFYVLYNVYKTLKQRYPPGFWLDLITWAASTRPIYYPGKARKHPPLLKEE